MRLFSLDSPFFRFLTLLSDLMILNILYVITCFPLFTAGAATSALYRSVLDLRYGLGTGIGPYFRYFKANLRQSTPRFLISAFIGVLLFFDIWYTRAGNLPLRGILVPAFTVLLTMLSAFSSWVLALTGQFDNTLKKTFRNAAFFTLRYLPVSLLLLLRFIPALLAYYVPQLFLLLAILFLLIYYSLTAYLAAIPMSRIFLRLMTPEEAEKRSV